MNKKYLNKVVNQLVSETIIDGDVAYTPFYPPNNLIKGYQLSSFINLFNKFLFPLPPVYFTEFVIDYYGLTEEEIKYVWEQWRSIINNRI